jgi:hypothetical protein
MTSQILKSQTQLPEPVILPTDLKSMIAALRSAQCNLHDISLKAYQLLNQHQVAKADALANNDNIGAKQALERLQHAKATREMC